MSFISKEGGGIGWYLGKIRPEDTYSYKIVKSNNITKWAKIINDIAVAVNQAGCVERNTLVEVLDSVEIDSKKYIIQDGSIYYRGDKYSIDEIEEVTCSKCGFKSKSIGTHINRQHNLNKKEYGGNVTSIIYRINKIKTTKSPFKRESYNSDEEYHNFIKSLKIPNNYDIKSLDHLDISDNEKREIIKGRKRNNANSLEKSIKKYGPIIGKEKWEKIINTISYKSSKEYYKKLGMTDEEIRKLKDNNSLSSYIDRLGKEEGTKQFNLYISNKHSTHWNTKYWMKKGFNEEESKNIISSLQSRKKEWWIKKYGEDEGMKKRDDWIIASRPTFKKMQSKESIDFINKVKEKINLKIKIREEIPIGTKNIDFSITHKNKTVFIEYYGDFWHANPSLFNDNDMILDKTAKEIRENDIIRINEIEEKIKTNIFIFWSSDNLDEFIYKIRKELV